MATAISVKNETNDKTGTNNEEAGAYEGVEKRLEIDLRRSVDCPEGPRSLGREFWSTVIATLNAVILDVTSNDDVDAYILSASSLFVSSTRITFITCGRTMLLNSLDVLLAGLQNKGLDVEFMQYSRKNITHPWVRSVPHCSIGDEYMILHKHFPSGHPYILGPLDGDHYFIYLLDNVDRPNTTETDQLLQLFIYDIAEDVSMLIQSESFAVNNAVTCAMRNATGISRIFQHFSTVQDAAFSPCGYSGNAIRDAEFLTAHIAPEYRGTFASIETNASVVSYADIVRTALDVFRPKRMTAVLFVDELSLAGRARSAGENIGAENIYSGFQMTQRTVNEFEPGYVTVKANYSRKEEVVDLPVGIIR